VETNGLRDGTWLDRSGSPMTEAARITERFQRINYGTLNKCYRFTDNEAVELLANAFTSHTSIST
jgi:hypothetical protein